MPPTTDPQPIDAARPDVLVRQMIMGFRLTQMIYAAAKLGIADALAEEPRTADDLAAACGAHPSALYRLLRALANVGLFKEDPGGRFELTSLGDCLRAAANGSLRGLAILYGEEWYYRTWAALLHSVRTGQSAFEHVHGLSLFDYLNQHPEAGTAFNDAMTSYSAQETAAILNAYNFSEITHVVDVGGGHGRLLAAIYEHTQKCEAHSSISQP